MAAAFLATPASAQDTVTVVAGDPPVWGPAPVLVEELRLGGIDGDERYTFGYVAGVATTPEGDVWVADRMLAVIRRYTADGRHLGDAGRKGNGPGEFEYLMDLRLMPDGSMAVWDPLNQRVHRFASDGRFLRDHRVPVPGMFGGRGLQTFEVGTEGAMYAIAVDRPEPGSRVSKPYWIRLGADGAIRDTVRRPPSDREGYHHPEHSWFVLAPDGSFVEGRNDEYALLRPLPDGRVLRIERDYEPVRYERDERREAQQLEDLYASRWADEPRRVPATKPVWSTFLIDADGRLWVERYVAGVRLGETAAEREARAAVDERMVAPSSDPTPERTWAQPLTYDVIGPQGRFFGTIVFPESATASPTERVSMMLARDREVWTIERGRFDEHYVVRYRIEAGPGR